MEQTKSHTGLSLAGLTDVRWAYMKEIRWIAWRAVLKMFCAECRELQLSSHRIWQLVSYEQGAGNNWNLVHWIVVFFAQCGLIRPLAQFRQDMKEARAAIWFKRGPKSKSRDCGKRENNFILLTISKHIHHSICVESEPWLKISLCTHWCSGK